MNVFKNVQERQKLCKFYKIAKKLIHIVQTEMFKINLYRER